MQHTVTHLLKFRQQHLLDVYLRIGEHCAILLRKSKTSSLHKQIFAVFGSNIAEQFIFIRCRLIHLVRNHGDVLRLAHTDVSRESDEEVAVRSYVLWVATCLEARGGGHCLRVSVRSANHLAMRNAERVFVLYIIFVDYSGTRAHERYEFRVYLGLAVKHAFVCHAAFIRACACHCDALLKI